MNNGVQPMVTDNIYHHPLHLWRRDERREGNRNRPTCLTFKVRNVLFFSFSDELTLYFSILKTL